MAYKGTKFKTIYQEKKVINHPRLPTLIKWCKLFHKENLSPPYPGGSFGNLSFRTNKDEFIISATCVPFANELKNEDFVKVVGFNLESKQVFVKGIKEPSSESMLHHQIYKNRKDIKVIFHGHSPEILAKAAEHNFVQTAKAVPYGSLELVEQVMQVIDANNFIVMREHGFLAFGATMEKTGQYSLKMLKKVR